MQESGCYAGNQAPPNFHGKINDPLLIALDRYYLTTSITLFLTIENYTSYIRDLSWEKAMDIKRNISHEKYPKLYDHVINPEKANIMLCIDYGGVAFS